MLTENVNTKIYRDHFTPIGYKKYMTPYVWIYMKVR